MPLQGSSAPYWVKSFWGLQSPLALQLPSEVRSAFLLESEYSLQGSVCRG